MAPKARERQRDAQLEAIRTYVRAHGPELAARRKTTLQACFACRTNAEETRHYFFLHKGEEHFTLAQRRHVEVTFKLLRAVPQGRRAREVSKRPAAAATGREEHRQEQLDVIREYVSHLFPPR